MWQPSDWLRLTVPAAFAIRYVPAWKNETLLFIVTGFAIIALAVWIVAEVGGDGECNWLEGAQPLSVYLTSGIRFFCLVEPSHVQNGKSGPARLNAISHTNPEPGQPRGSQA